MATTKVILHSFAGGELSQDMYARSDDKKHQTGAAIMKNFIATPQGPVINRAGFEFVREAKLQDKRCRLIPFTYNNDQTVVIEFGEGYLRFHTQGGTIVDSEE